MTLQEYIDEIKLELTGGILELEIPDETIGNVVKKALREIQRYIDSSVFITIPYAPCIDLKDFKFSAFVNVYRTEGYVGDGISTINGMVDPMYAQRWSIFSNGGVMYNLQSYILNYMSYNTLLQMRNNATTDLSHIYDKANEKLYINVAYDRPEKITIEYIPIYQDVCEVVSDYWIDILYRMSLAMVKVILGRIRSRYKIQNAQWEQDGETMLEEGNTELKELREVLRTNSTLFYPVD